jgi:hypothetical protein
MDIQMRDLIVRACSGKTLNVPMKNLRIIRRWLRDFRPPPTIYEAVTRPRFSPTRS